MIMTTLADNLHWVQPDESYYVFHNVVKREKPSLRYATVCVSWSLSFESRV